MQEKNNRGITLISLVITIILLLILATVVINIAIDSEGLFGKANEARNTWNSAVEEEKSVLENLMHELDKLDKVEVTNSVSISADKNTWTAGDVTVTLEYENVPTGYEIQYKENDGEWMPGTSVVVKTNNTTVKARLYNASVEDEIATNSKTISIIDKDNPNAPTGIEKTASINSITVKATGGSDVAGGSGLKGYQYSLNGTSWTETITSETTYTFESLSSATKYTVYARTIDGVDRISGNYTLEVQTETIAVESVTLNKTTTSVGIGETETLVATISPNNANNTNITWSSNNNAVATVDKNGVVTAVSEGRAIITATTEDGEKTAQCEVTVIDTRTKLTIYFTDMATSETLQGGSVEVYSDATCTNLLFTADLSQEYNEVSELEAGSYYIKVTSVPAGYDSISEVITKTIVANQNNEWNIALNKLYGVTISFIDASTSVEVQGGTVEVYSDESCTNLLFTADLSEANSYSLPVGEYYIKVIKVPDSYNTITEIITETIESNQTNTWEMEIKKGAELPAPGGNLLKYVEIDSQSITVYGTFEGISISLYRVGSRAADGTLVLDGDFADYPISLDETSSEALADAAQTLQTFAIQFQHEPYASGATSAEDNSLKFSYLEEGLYLLCFESLWVEDNLYYNSPGLFEITGE